MANRRTKKNSSSTNSSKQPTSVEMKAWYDKNKKAVDALTQISDPAKRNNKSLATFNRDNLRQYMENPYANERQLRELSRFLYNRSQVYKRLINYNANMIDLNYRQVIPIINLVKGGDKKKVLKSYYETLTMLENANLDLGFQPATVVAFREDVFYGCAYWDELGFFILPLDPDFCKVSGVYNDGSLAFYMDMSYFSRKQELLEFLGEPFQSMWNEYQKNTTSNKWQLFPSENAVCLKCDLTDCEHPIPPFSGMFDSLVSLEDLRAINDISDEQDIYKMLVCELPRNNGTTDDFTVSPNVAAAYFNRIKEELPDYMGAILAPFPVKDIQFDSDQTNKVNKIENSTKAVLNTSGGAQVLNSSSISGSTSWEGAIHSDEDMALSSLLPQIQAVINRLIAYRVKNPSKIKLLGITTYTLKQHRDAIIKSCTYGVPNKLLLGTLNGFSELETLSLEFLENEVFDLSSKFKPLQSSNTQDTSNIGRPTAEDSGSDLSEDGEASRDKKDRAN